MTRSIVPMPIPFSSVRFAATLSEHRSVFFMLNLRAMRRCAVAHINTQFFKDQALRQVAGTGCGVRDAQHRYEGWCKETCLLHRPAAAALVAETPFLPRSPALANGGLRLKTEAEALE